MISAVESPRPGAAARAVTRTCSADAVGLQVAEYSPTWGLVSFIARAGSPFENVATIWALRTGSPQSSARRTIRVSGQPAGAEKLFTRPVCVRESRDGRHP